MKKKKSKSKTKDIEAGGMCYDTKKTDVFVFNGLKHDDANLILHLQRISA